MSKTKLTLVMIVKNEASNIRDVIGSVAGIIDHWCILDTGSIDGTQDIIKETIAAHGLSEKGLLVEDAFVDFSTTRNMVVEVAYRLYPDSWQIMLSGTETVADAQTLWHELDYWSTRTTFTAFHVEMRCGATHFPSLRVFKPSAGWRYKGRYHELLTPPLEGLPASGPTFKDTHINYAGGEDKTETWRKAIPLLELDAKENPEDGRPIFYLAEVHRCLGAKTVAYLLYEKRVSMRSGYDEERAMSALYAGRLAKDKWPDQTMLDHWLTAYSICPQRAEPLWELGSYYHLRGYRENNPELYALAYLYACAAYEKPMPAHGLFVETPVYLWQVPDLVATHALRYNDFKRGEEAAKKAADNIPLNEINYPRVQANYDWYKNRGKT